MVNWLLDADMFEGYRDELAAAIREQGHQVKLIQTPAPPFRWDDVGCSYRDSFPAGSCVVAHGDIELVTRIHQEGRWTPGAFCNIEEFAWSNYACHFGAYLLNRDYIMLPFGELDRCQDFLFASVGEDDRVFVRPDSPLKLFTGQIATKKTFQADLDFMGFYEFPAGTLVVISSPKKIRNEWRFVIADGKVVAGCQYKCGDHLEVDANFDPDARSFAQSIASLGYGPDRVWIMDICKTAEQSYRLLEIGGFSFSDLYACHMPTVVSSVSKVAGSVWRESQL